MRAELEHEGVPDLVAQPIRTPGIHLSDVIRRICIFRGDFEDTDDPNEVLWDIGVNHEYAVKQRLHRDHPGRFMELGEIEVDGIKMNLDLLDTEPWRPWEVKLTRMSAKHEPGSAKFWKYEAQVKGYCKGIKSLAAALDVTHLDGYYERDYSKRKAIRRIWAYTFSEREIYEFWRMILTTAADM